MHFAVYTSKFDETFIGRGSSPRAAYKDLKGQWMDTPLEQVKFYDARPINPVVRAHFAKELSK